MKKSPLLLFFLIVIGSLLVGCCPTKSTGSTTNLYDSAWELEYISGPRIAFNGLYPDKKPFLVFNAQENQFGGNTSCNVYSGKYTLKETSLQFGEAIKTMIFCEGGGEETFLKMLGKVNRYAFDSDGKLLLLTDDIPILRFKKIAKPNNN